MSPEEEAKATIHNFFEAMNTQNMEAMQQLIPKTDTTIHIGTDEGDIWRGWHILFEATKEQFEGLEYYKANVYNLTVNLSESAKVAWYFHNLDAEIKSRGKVTRWQGARFTGVLQQTGGQWKIAQTHVSIPSSQ